MIALAKTIETLKEMPSYVMEEYLSILYELKRSKGYIVMKEAANRLNVSPASVTSMLKRLQKEGYIKYERYKGVTLTERGEQVAEEVLRKQHVLLEFLNTLGINIREAYQEARRMEHCINITTTERLEKFLQIIKADRRILEKLQKRQ